MRVTSIRINTAYRNRGKGTTVRLVLRIGDDCRPENWYGRNARPNEAGVLYAQVVRDDTLRFGRAYLSTFAHWAGSFALPSEETYLRGLVQAYSERSE